MFKLSRQINKPRYIREYSHAFGVLYSDATSARNFTLTKWLPLIVFYVTLFTTWNFVAYTIGHTPSMPPISEQSITQRYELHLAYQDYLEGRSRVVTLFKHR